MLRTRLWMGGLLVVLAVGMVVADQWLEPWYPFLLITVLALSLLAGLELRALLSPSVRPPAWFCCLTVAGLALANWLPLLLPALAPGVKWDSEPWNWVLGVFATVVLTSFLLEMAVFRGSGDSVARMATAVWMASYLGLLPCFIVQLRWLGDGRGGVALALAIFVPKTCDSGAYFTGRWIGKHRMTPLLSPNKTWEGAAGGLLAAVAAAIAINRLGPALNQGLAAEIGFGITVGLAALLGDLAESLIKRDSGRKDASQAVPGFGGILDIVDSVIFSAPVSYWWLKGVGEW
jgi:phosphatidate cytidylyltransferase